MGTSLTSLPELSHRPGHHTVVQYWVEFTQFGEEITKNEWVGLTEEWVGLTDEWMGLTEEWVGLTEE